MFAELLDKHIDKASPPDFIISVLYAGGESALVRQLNSFSIPFMTVNTSISDDVFRDLGKPRENLRYWLGHMSPDERLSASVLLQEMHKLSMGNHVLAIAGHSQSAVNHQRVRGLVEKASELRLTLAPPIFTDWSKADAYRVARTLFQRVEHHDMIWTAGPAIAAAVSQLISENPAYQKEKIITGTFDWSIEAIELVKQGKVQLSYGGHFMETGWVLVLVHDYLQGLDFTSDTGTLIRSKLKRMDRQNVQRIEKLVNAKNWKNIDFRRYSKCHNEALNRYVFDIESSF